MLKMGKEKVAKVTLLVLSWANDGWVVSEIRTLKM